MDYLNNTTGIADLDTRGRSVAEFLSHLRTLGVRLSTDQGRLNCTAPKGVLTPALTAELKDLKPQIIQFLIENGQTHNAPIPRLKRERYLSPSSAQQRLWFLEQFEPESTAYSIVGALRLSGKLNRAALEQSLAEIIRRHEVLRTNFIEVDGVPKLLTRPATEWHLHVVSLLDTLESQREECVLNAIAERSRIPFNLSEDTLLRARLFITGESEYVLMINVHHIAADGWSLALIVDELTKLYPAFCEGRPSPLEELPIQYCDFADWHSRLSGSGLMRSQLPYWKQQLRSPLGICELPYDRPRPPKATYQGRRVRQILPGELLKAVERVSLAERVTTFTTLLATFKLLLFRYTHQPDVIVGSASAGRSRTELETLVGLFTKNLVLRTDLSGNPTVHELLNRVGETTLNAFSHDEVPFDRLVEILQLHREVNRSPLFQVMFILQNFRRPSFTLPDLTIKLLEFDQGTSRFDITVEAMEKDGELVLDWEYNTDLFDASTIERMQRHYGHLLEQVTADTARHVSELQVVTSTEKKQIELAAESTRTDYPKTLCLHTLIEQQAARTPQSIAVTCGERQMTYEELNLRSNRLANRLRALGAGPEKLVALCVDRSPELVVALLGILKAGGAYLPLDPQFPQDRLEFMLEDSGAVVLLTEEHLLGVLPPVNIPAVCLDLEKERLDSENGALSASGVSPENLAYVIYTSGSTGKPKGVEITHRSVVNFLTSMKSEPGMTSADSLLAVTTLSFDIAVLEMYLPLTVGARVVIAPRNVVADGVALAKLLQKSGCTVMQATPVTWRLLLDSGWTGTPVLKVLCGGEALPRELAVRLLATGADVWNLYGPTETTVWSTVHRVVPAPGAVSIGKAIANTELYVLDQHFNPVPPGVPGDLYIGGDGLARGYLHRPELTAEKFIPHPFRAGKRVYRTGDVARWLPDGTLDFRGRVDHQVKLRGFRIELGEIETAMEQQPDVQQAIAVVREDVPGDQRLIAYVVGRDEEKVNIRELREALLTKLPEYMVPSVFVQLESFPLTPNKKVDRKVLPPPDAQVAVSAQYVPPATPAEKEMAEIWQELLNRARVGTHDNFFDLGGHSLLVVQLQSKIRQRFKREISLVELFQRPTVAAIAPLLESDCAAQTVHNGTAALHQ